MLKRLTLAALGASLLAGSALAAQAEPQDGPRGPRPDPLAMADTNKDGIVTRDEMMASVASRFQAMDANHDGKVTPEEREAFQAAMRARMGGGRMAPKRDLTLADEQGRAARMFDMVDTNHDGKIDAAERQAAMQRMMKMGGGGGRRDRQGPPPGDMPPPPPTDGN